MRSMVLAMFSLLAILQPLTKSNIRQPLTLVKGLILR
jgi:hypothetical protein